MNILGYSTQDRKWRRVKSPSNILPPYLIKVLLHCAIISATYLAMLENVALYTQEMKCTALRDLRNL